MKIEKKLLSATLFTSLFKDGRREVKSYDESTKTLKIRNLVTNRDSNVYLGGAPMFARYWDVLSGGMTEYEADSRAIRHGIENEGHVTKIIKHNTNFKLYSEHHKFRTPLTSCVLDLCASNSEDNIKELYEIKCPFDKGKKLLYLLNNKGVSSEAKEQLVLHHDPAWWGQVQFYLFSLQIMRPKAYLVIFEPLFEEGLNFIRVTPDQRVFNFIEAVSKIINNELEKLAKKINKNSITLIPDDGCDEVPPFDQENLYQTPYKKYSFNKD